MNSDKNLKKLGLQIREIRKSKDISQEELAFRAGIDRSYFGGIERGERNISFLTLVKIAISLNCDIAKFTKGIPNE